MAFVLVFFDNPPSSAIVHKSDIFGGVDISQKRLVRWSRDQLMARIVMTGTKKHLSTVHVTADGEVWEADRGPDAERVQRRRELLREQQRERVQYRTAADAARDHFLYQLTDEAAREGGDNAGAGEVHQDDEDGADLNGELNEGEEQRLEALLRDKETVQDMIKALPLPLTRNAVKAIMDRLPCMKAPAPADKDKFVQLSKKENVFIPAHEAWALKKLYKESAPKFFKGLLCECARRGTKFAPCHMYRHAGHSGCTQGNRPGCELLCCKKTFGVREVRDKMRFEPRNCKPN